MRETLYSILLEFVRENSKYIWGYGALSLVFPLSEVALPHFYGKIIDGVARVKNPKDVFSANSKNIKIVIALWSINQLLYGSLYKLDEHFIPKLQSFVRKKVVDLTIESSAENYHDLEVGEILSRIFKLPMIVKDLFRQMRNVFLPTLLIMIAASGYLFSVHPLLGSITFISMVIFITLLKTFAFECVKKADDLDKRHDSLHEEIDDMLSNLLNIYAANTMEDESERLSRLQSEYNKHYSDTIWCSSKFKWLFNISYFMFFLLLNGVAMNLYSKGRIELNSLSSVLIVSLYLINQLSVVSHEIRDFIYDMGTLKQLEKYIDSLNIKERYTPPKSDLGEIESLSVNIKGKNTPIQFKLERGDIMTLSGDVGCGKSTCVKSIMKLHPYEGVIKLNDRELSEIDLKTLRQKYIYIPQQAKLFNRSIRDNISYGTDASLSDIKEVVKLIGFTEDLNRLSGKNGSNLSGGQRQIVHLLRALLNKEGTIIILDEPSSAMDYETEKQVLKLIKLLSENRICIIISHNESVKSIAKYNYSLV